MIAARASLNPAAALAARAQGESLRLATFVAVVEILAPGSPSRSALLASPRRLRSFHRGGEFVAVGEQFRGGVPVGAAPAWRRIAAGLLPSTTEIRRFDPDLSK